MGRVSSSQLVIQENSKGKVVVDEGCSIDSLSNSVSRRQGRKDFFSSKKPLHENQEYGSW